MKRHRARKRFGQHFLTDPGVIAAIVNAIAPARDDVIVEIEDDGVGATRLPGSGQGIAGMRERAESLGGTLDAGARDGNGFLVVARLPVSEEPP